MVSEIEPHIQKWAQMGLWSLAKHIAHYTIQNEFFFVFYSFWSYCFLNYFNKHGNVGIYQSFC